MSENDAVTRSTTVHVPVSGKLLDALDAFIAGQDYPPTRVEVLRRALEEYLVQVEQHGGGL